MYRQDRKGWASNNWNSKGAIYQSTTSSKNYWTQPRIDQIEELKAQLKTKEEMYDDVKNLNKELSDTR